MSDKVSFKVDFGEAASYTPYDGLGASALLKQDGLYKATIQKVIPGRSKSGNPKFTLSIVVQDEDEKGQSIIGDVLAGGRDKDGNPLSRKLWDVFFSMGMTQDQVRALASNGQQDEAVVVNALTGKTVFVNIEAETWEGKTSSRIQSFTSGQKYADAIAANAHRKPRKADVAFTGAPAGISTPAPAASLNGSGSPVASAPAAADPLSRLRGLNLPV